MRRPAVAFALVGVSLVAVACPSTRERTGSAPVSVPSVAAGGAPTAAAAIRELCVGGGGGGRGE
jgi:hypothetical protein